MISNNCKSIYQSVHLPNDHYWIWFVILLLFRKSRLKEVKEQLKNAQLENDRKNKIISSTKEGSLEKVALWYNIFLIYFAHLSIITNSIYYLLLVNGSGSNKESIESNGREVEASCERVEQKGTNISEKRKYMNISLLSLFRINCTMNWRVSWRFKW